MTRRILPLLLLALLALTPGCITKQTKVIPADLIDPRTGKEIFLYTGHDVQGHFYIYNAERNQKELSDQPFTLPPGLIVMFDRRLPATQPTTRPSP